MLSDDTVIEDIVGSNLLLDVKYDEPKPKIKSYKIAIPQQTVVLRNFFNEILEQILSGAFTTIIKILEQYQSEQAGSIKADELELLNQKDDKG